MDVYVYFLKYKIHGQQEVSENGDITLVEFKTLYQEYYDFTDEELEALFDGIAFSQAVPY